MSMVPDPSSQVIQSVPSGRCEAYIVVEVVEVEVVVVFVVVVGWSMLRPKTETHGPEWKPRQVAGLVVGSAACKVFRLLQSVISAVGLAQSGKLGNSVFLSVHEVGCEGAVHLGGCPSYAVLRIRHRGTATPGSQQRWPFSHADPERAAGSPSETQEAPASPRRSGHASQRLCFR